MCVQNEQNEPLTINHIFKTICASREEKFMNCTKIALYRKSYRVLKINFLWMQLFRGDLKYYVFYFFRKNYIYVFFS